MKLEFKEEQRFSQPWIYIPIAFTGLLILFGIYKQMVIGEPFGNKPMSNEGLIIVLLFNVGLLVLFQKMCLKTTIDDQGIHIRFIPFVNKQIKWTDIKKAEVLKYGFVGGWGIRFGTKYGTVYNTSGNIGLAIELENGKKYCIGTQQKEALTLVVEAALRKQSS